jgi:hypothetical protein
MIIISEFVFYQQQNDLVQLGVAIDDVGARVLRLFEGLPEKEREELEAKFDDVLTGIYGTCHCLAIVAQVKANYADEWAHWARKENIKIEFKG